MSSTLTRESVSFNVESMPNSLPLNQVPARDLLLTVNKACIHADLPTMFDLSAIDEIVETSNHYFCGGNSVNAKALNEIMNVLDLSENATLNDFYQNLVDFYEIIKI